MASEPDPGRLGAAIPRDFRLGVGSSAYQIEGSWDADGKGPSIWDDFCRRPGAIANSETGEIACDHYRRYQDDVALMAECRLTDYRFSISWPRVLPMGSGDSNEAGLAFYDALVDALLERGIRPIATLHHWDLPSELQSRGGWGARDTVGWFGQYAELIARRLGDRVSCWLTINEPAVLAFHGHANGTHAPGLRSWPLALRVAHNLLLAHREAATAIRSRVQGADVGIALNLYPCDPASEAPDDVAAAARMDGHQNRWFLDPLIGRGYPTDLVAWYGSDLPEALVHEMAGYRGEMDFLGVNYYTRQVIRAATDGLLRARAEVPSSSARTSTGWEVYPDGLARVLRRLHDEYGPLRLVVTENGAAFEDRPDNAGWVDDRRRVQYLADHLAVLARVIGEGIPVEGYLAWTFLDNFEWEAGFVKRFGLVSVDYPSQRRTLKASAHWYRRLIESSRGHGREPGSWKPSQVPNRDNPSVEMPTKADLPGR